MRIGPSTLLAVVGWVGLILGSPGLTSAKPDAAKIAAEVSTRLHQELPDSETVGKCDDATWLRRVSLDVIGQPPTTSELSSFAADSRPEKYRETIRRLLASEEYGQNWARYWRDVIVVRRTDDRSLVGVPPLRDYLVKQFNDNVPWNKIAADFVSASGEVSEHGNAGLIVAQWGDPNAVAAETARVFLGIQIQCAQCHDHPYDRWKREQFHELVAFFPRIGLRSQPQAEKLALQVVSLDRPSGMRAPGVRGETLTEHFLPDLKDPKARGKQTTPKFFLTGQTVPVGTSDVERRTKLAQWMTAPKSKWFATAMVNRMWSELIGQGFYPAVDDLGPDHEPLAPQTSAYLTKAFMDSGYDVKWLVETITLTDIYRQASRSRVEEKKLAVSEVCLQRLRADQLFNRLASALDIDEERVLARIHERSGKNRKQAFEGPRGQVVRQFTFDPSFAHDDVLTSIPQALWLMNGGEVSRSINAKRPAASLSKLLAEKKDNDAAVRELYLQTLTREPRSEELQTCRDYLKQVGNRALAFEDLQWALINSTEFLYRN